MLACTGHVATRVLYSKWQTQRKGEEMLHPPNTRPIHVLNYGGGRNTIAVLVLIAEGVLPRPDYIVIADTGREAQSTWDYLHAHAQPYCEQHGIGTIHIASHELARVDLYDSRAGKPIMPLHTATGAPLPNFCSAEWKREVVARWMARQGHPPRTRCNWIGYAFEEKRRYAKRQQQVQAGELWFPLVAAMVTSETGNMLIQRAGLPVPEKSACYMCPYRRNAEWRHIRDNYPDQWQAAIALDEELRANDERGGVWLHHSRVPLAEADIDSDDTRSVTGRQCSLGLCFV